MSDHRVDIYEALESYTQSLRDVFESGDEDRHWTDEVLEIEVFRSTTWGNHTIVEFLLTYGGPTARVTVRPRGGVEFFHSWGCDYRKRVPDHDGGLTYPDLTTIEVFGDNADFWQSLADEVSELS